MCYLTLGAKRGENKTAENIFYYTCQYSDFF